MSNKCIKVRSKKDSVSENTVFFLIVIPFMALFFLFNILPVLASIVLSFFDYDMVSSPIFTGLENYSRKEAEEIIESFGGKTASSVSKKTSMVLAGDTSSLLAPGQFVNIKLDGKFLRRPISVCDYNEETITLIYKVVGEGTEQMANMKAGERLDVLVGLGNGFNPEKSGENPRDCQRRRVLKRGRSRFVRYGSLKLKHQGAR